MNQVCVSAGADSTALALLLWERGEEFELLFSDTGAELLENYWLLPRLAQLTGKPLNVVSGGGFFRRLVSFGYFLPSPRARWCTRELKQDPLDDFHAKHAQGGEVFMGLCADEAERATRLTATKERNNSPIHTRFPLIEAGLSKADCRRLCTKYGMLNPAYQWRQNVSCFCCFFQSWHDWLGLLQNHPDLYRVAEEWEEQSIRRTKTGFGWREGNTLKALRSVDEKQLRLWPEPEGEPCVICRV